MNAAKSNIRKLSSAFLAASLLLSGCASTYGGLGPNTFVKEPAEVAAQEQQFHLSSPTFTPGYRLDDKLYASTSVLPIVAGVSPEAARQLSSGSSYWGSGALITLAGLFAIATASKEQKKTAAAITLGGLALFVYGQYKIKAGVERYNRDLHESLRIEREF